MSNVTVQKEDRKKIDSSDKPSIYGCEGLFFFLAQAEVIYKFGIEKG